MSLKSFALNLVALSFFAASAQASDLRCYGTEPFWSLKVTKDSMLLHLPEMDHPESMNVVSKTSALGTPETLVRVYKSPFNSLTVLAGECTDGMSDREYQFHAVFDRFGTIFYGCCSQE